MQIRQLINQDLPELAQLFQTLETGAWANELKPEELAQVLEQRLQLAQGQSLMLVADSGRQLVGYAAVHWIPFLVLPGPEGYLSELFVHPAYRGQGLGQQLLAAIEQAAVESGVYRLGLVNLKDRLSYQRGFYSDLGWQERAEAAHFVKVLPKRG